MTTKAENTKITAAIKARSAGAKAVRAAVAKENAKLIQGIREAIQDGTEIEEIQDVGVPAPLAPGAVLGVPSRKARGAQQRSKPVSKAKAGIILPPEKIVRYGPREPRVLADPVANAKLVRMRAKWAAIRAERKAARIEEKHGEQSVEAGIARAVVADFWAEEREKYDAYRRLLLESKGKDPADDLQGWTESEMRAMAGDR